MPELRVASLHLETMVANPRREATGRGYHRVVFQAARCPDGRFMTNAEAVAFPEAMGHWGIVHDVCIWTEWRGLILCLRLDQPLNVRPGTVLAFRRHHLVWLAQRRPPLVH